MQTAKTQSKQIAAFFFGSFIRPEIMALGGFHPTSIEVAKLNGYDIAFDPHANVFRSESHSICGILVYPTHEQLNKLYSRDGVGIFLPEAVIVETKNGLLPALCFMPPARGIGAPDIDYVRLVLAAGKYHGFPAWYLDHISKVANINQPT
jgi:hypothetical protein